MSEFVFKPVNPVQDEFMWSTARWTHIDGGIGSSKTTGGLARLLVLASQFPGSRWVVFRQTYLDLIHTTRKTFKDKVAPADWIVRDVRELTTLANGSEIIWMHLDEMTEQSLRGLEINGAFGDQIEEINPELIEILDSRLGRWQLPEWETPCPPYLWSTSNPKGRDHVYYRFHPNVVKYDTVKMYEEWDKQQLEAVAQMGFPVDTKYFSPTLAAYSQDKAYFFGSTLINLPRLQEMEPTYVRNLMRKPESWKRQWVYGSRDFFEGSLHPTFKENIHTYDQQQFDPLQLRPIKTVLAWFDYGLTHPTVLNITARDAEGFHWFIHEYGGPNKTVEQHAHEIKQRMGQYNPSVIFADPQVFFEMTRDRKVMTKSIAEEYAQYGIAFVKADNNEETSINKIEEMLQVDAGRMNPITRKPGSPRVFFSKQCVKTIEQIQQQRRKESRNILTGEKEFLDERDDSVPDDYYDTVRYWANSKYLDYEPWTGEIHVPSYGSKPRSKEPSRGYATVGR